MPIHKHLRRRKSLQSPESTSPETTLKMEMEVQRRCSGSSGSYNFDSSISRTFSRTLDEENNSHHNHNHHNQTEDHGSTGGNSVVVSEDAEDSEHEDNNAPFFTVGTRVKHYEMGRVGWIHGNVVAVSKDENLPKAPGSSSIHSSYMYTVLYENGSIDEYDESKLSKMVDLGQVCLGGRIAVYWAGDKAYYNARVTKIDNRKIACYRIAYIDDNEKEWIDLRNETFVVLHDDDDLEEAGIVMNNKEEECTNTPKSSTVRTNKSSSLVNMSNNTTAKRRKSARKVVEDDDSQNAGIVVEDEFEYENKETTTKTRKRKNARKSRNDCSEGLVLEDEGEIFMNNKEDEDECRNTSKSCNILTNKSSSSVNMSNNTSRTKGKKNARKVTKDVDSQDGVVVEDEFENENKDITIKTRKRRKNARKFIDDDDDESQVGGLVAKDVIENQNHDTATKTSKRRKNSRKFVDDDDDYDNQDAGVVVDHEIENENQHPTTTKKNKKLTRKVIDDNDDYQNEVAVVEDEIENENQIIYKEKKGKRKKTRKADDDEHCYHRGKGVLVKDEIENGNHYAPKETRKKQKKTRKVGDDEDDFHGDEAVVKKEIENRSQNKITETRKKRKTRKFIDDDDDDDSQYQEKGKDDNVNQNAGVTNSFCTSGNASSALVNIENNSMEKRVRGGKIARDAIHDNDNRYEVVSGEDSEKDCQATISTKAICSFTDALSSAGNLKNNSTTKIRQRTKMARKVVRSEITISGGSMGKKRTWKGASIDHSGLWQSQNKEKNNSNRSRNDEEQPSNSMRRISSSLVQMLSRGGANKEQPNNLEGGISLCIEEEENLFYLESEEETLKEKQIPKKRKVGRPRKNPIESYEVGRHERNDIDNTRRKIKTCGLKKKLEIAFSSPMQPTSLKRKRDFIETDDYDFQSCKRPQRCKEPKASSEKSITSKSIRHYDSWNARTTNEQNSLLVKLKVGTPVSVYWAEDDRYYRGVVGKMKDFRSKKPHFIEYDDGDSEWIDLADHVFDILPENRSSDESKNNKREQQSTKIEASSRSTTTRRKSVERSFDSTAAHQPVVKEHSALIAKPSEVGGISVGARVAVWWEEDSQFYKGTISKVRKRGKPFFIEYDDGDEEWLNLRQQKFILLQTSSVEAGAEPDLESLGGAEITDDNGYDFPGPPGILVGSRISVWWPHEKQYYDCTITKRRDCKKGFYLEYDDGDREWLDLTKAKYSVLSSRRPKRCSNF